MTPAELDALAQVQAEIRAIFDAARTRVGAWDPFAPSSLPQAARRLEEDGA